MATLPSNPPDPSARALRAALVSVIADRCPTCRAYGEHTVHRYPSGLTVQLCEQGWCDGARCWTPPGVLLELAAGGRR